MPSQNLRRLRDFPEIQALELAALINPALCTLDQRFYNDQTDAVAKAVFGVTALEVTDWVFGPLTAIEYRLEDGEAVDESEQIAAVETYNARQDRLLAGWEDGMDIAAFCTKFGWDLRNAEGKQLLMAENLFGPLMAAITGSAGATLPPEGVETLAVWEAKLKIQAPRPRPSRPLNATPPISEEERRRRNEEAKRATVWRPESRKA